MKRLKSWNWTLTLCVVLLGLNLWQGKRLSELERDIWNAQNSVMNNISGMDRRLSSLYAELESADDLVEDWNYESAVNMERRGLDIKVSLVLKEWQGDTAVELLCGDLNAPGGEKAVPLSGNGAGTFTGTVELPLSGEYTEYTADAVITSGDTQRRESLGWLGDLESLLPLRCNARGLGGYSYRNGVFTLSNCSVYLDTQSEKIPEEITDTVFCLSRNGETMEAQTAKQGDRMGTYEYNEELSAECRAGDELILTFSCRDGYGLDYKFFVQAWTVEENGIARSAPIVKYPVVTWN